MMMDNQIPPSQSMDLLSPNRIIYLQPPLHQEQGSIHKCGQPLGGYMWLF